MLWLQRYIFFFSSFCGGPSCCSMCFFISSCAEAVWSFCCPQIALWIELSLKKEPSCKRMDQCSNQPGTCSADAYLTCLPLSLSLTPSLISTLLISPPLSHNEGTRPLHLRRCRRRRSREVHPRVYPRLHQDHEVSLFPQVCFAWMTRRSIRFVVLVKWNEVDTAGLDVDSPSGSLAGRQAA